MRRENVLLLGPPGAGTTHLALALRVKAVTKGSSVAAMTADELLDQLRRDDVAGLRRMRRRRDSPAAVLVIDEPGFSGPRPPMRHLADLMPRVARGRGVKVTRR